MSSEASDETVLDWNESTPSLTAWSSSNAAAAPVPKVPTTGTGTRPRRTYGSRNVAGFLGRTDFLKPRANSTWLREGSAEASGTLAEPWALETTASVFTDQRSASSVSETEPPPVPRPEAYSRDRAISSPWQPPPKTLRRSQSLAFPRSTEHTLVRSATVVSSFSLRDSYTEETPLDFGENGHPNHSPYAPTRKAKVLARCNSLQMTNRPGYLASQSVSSFPSLESSPTKTLRECSSSTETTTSSRKRGVCGSPISQYGEDDYDGDYNDGDRNRVVLSASRPASSGSHSGRRIRSRSRIFSPGSDVPFAPLLRAESVRTPLNTSLSPLLSAQDCRPMQVDSDSDSAGPHSPHTSFREDEDEDDLHPSAPSTFSASVEPILTNPDDQLFATMSSYDDLKYIIRCLRKETKLFGKESWTVSPQLSWTNVRRSAFLCWTTRTLGFTLRAIGNSATYLSISKAKGQELKERLESALLAYKQKEIWTARQPEAVPFPIHTDTIARPSSVASLVLDPPPYADWRDPDTDALAHGLQSLSVRATSTAVHMTRTVTLEPVPDHAPVWSRDLQLLGHTSPTKGGKLSLASVRSSYSAYSVTMNAGTECLETPLNTQDQGWGSCPVHGRDWGTSSACDEAVSRELTERFEESCKVAGIRGSREPSPTSSLPLLPCEFDAVAEIEATESKRMSIASCESTAQVQEYNVDEMRQLRRRKTSYAKHQRMSLYVSATQATQPVLPTRKSLFPVLGKLQEEPSKCLSTRDEFPSMASLATAMPSVADKDATVVCPAVDEGILTTIFGFLNERELLCQASLVSTAWADAATTAHATMMLASVGYLDEVESLEEDDQSTDTVVCRSAAAKAMEWSWNKLTGQFPWGCFLSEGAFKQVFKVYNTAVRTEEAVSVMDVDAITDKKTIGAELAVSALLSSLTRRGVCPNFILTRGVFTSPYAPPPTHWGNANKKKPLGKSFVKVKSGPKEPKDAHPGRFQFIRMELCRQGDAEEFLKRQPNEMLDPRMSQAFVFQIAFALHAAADRFSLKHYDLKLLNIFVQDIVAQTDAVVMRYGLGSHMFSLRMPSEQAVVAKLADYGTANIKADTNGQPVTIAQFTTLENTPPDFMILGDEARQGHSHDCFGLGLCMLHLFTGHAPYEEILEEVVCPPVLKKKLRRIWEEEKVKGYDAIRSVILCDVYKDEAGNIVEGEPDDTLYDTFYRYLVLFGVPEAFHQKKCPKVWKAISDTLQHAGPGKGGRPVRKKQGTDAAQYLQDSRQFSIRAGSNILIRQAREILQAMPGGMELLLRLCAFDPSQRASAMDVLNSSFMENLREPDGVDTTGPNDTVFSYTAFSTSGALV
jgi:hypothetical protein